MRVTIDGVSYVPETHLFRLTDEHFDAAGRLPLPFDAIKWAHECQASVAEMEAWSRAVHVEPVEQRKVEPLPVPGKARKTGLFD